MHLEVDSRRNLYDRITSMNERDSVKTTEYMVRKDEYFSVSDVADTRARELLNLAHAIAEQSEKRALKVGAGIVGTTVRSVESNNNQFHAEVNALLDFFAECIVNRVSPDISMLVVAASGDAVTDPNVCGPCLATISRFTHKQRTRNGDFPVYVRRRDGTIYRRNFSDLHPEPFEPIRVEVSELIRRVLQKMRKKGFPVAESHIPEDILQKIYEINRKIKE